MTLLRRAKAVETKLERAVSTATDTTSPRIKVAGTSFPDSPLSTHRCGLLHRSASLQQATLTPHMHAAAYDSGCSRAAQSH